MLSNEYLNSDFDEDQLPPGQQPILTENIKKFNMCIKLIIESKQKTGYSTMGVATGPAGFGKTIAIRHYVSELTSRPHTGLPECILIRVKPHSTPNALVEDILVSLGERVPRLNRYKIADEAAKAIIRNDLKLLFVDEADQLNEDGFEFLRYIFGKTGCPIIIVGLPSILPIITRHEKFASRIGLQIQFLSPTEKEILNTILPKLVFPRWTFDPANTTDYTMGQKLWKNVKPSLRELRVMLEYASQLAEMQKEARITTQVLEGVYEMRVPRKRSKRLDEQEDKIQPNQPQTAYEVESQQRKDAKTSKGKKLQQE